MQLTYLKISTKNLFYLLAQQVMVKKEVMSMTVDNYLKTTSDYHNADNLKDVIYQMKGKHVIRTFKLKRNKTNNFNTFKEKFHRALMH